LKKIKGWLMDKPSVMLDRHAKNARHRKGHHPSGQIVGLQKTQTRNLTVSMEWMIRET
jgi:hypothetical protein